MLRVLRALPAGALFLATGACAAGSSSAAAQDTVSAPERLSAFDSVYSATQADRGEAIFGQVCSACHAASAFHGTIFQRAWNGRAVYWLFDLLRNTMPQDNPGGLAPQEYADVIAYILELNAYPAGDAELPAEPEELRRIHIQMEPDSAR